MTRNWGPTDPFLCACAQATRGGALGRCAPPCSSIPQCSSRHRYKLNIAQRRLLMRGCQRLQNHLIRWLWFRSECRGGCCVLRAHKSQTLYEGTAHRTQQSKTTPVPSEHRHAGDIESASNTPTATPCHTDLVPIHRVCTCTEPSRVCRRPLRHAPPPGIGSVDAMHHR